MPPPTTEAPPSDAEIARTRANEARAANLKKARDAKAAKAAEEPETKEDKGRRPPRSLATSPELLVQWYLSAEKEKAQRTQPKKGWRRPAGHDACPCGSGQRYRS